MDIHSLKTHIHGGTAFPLRGDWPHYSGGWWLKACAESLVGCHGGSLLWPPHLIAALNFLSVNLRLLGRALTFMPVTCSLPDKHSLENLVKGAGLG